MNAAKVVVNNSFSWSTDVLVPFGFSPDRRRPRRLECDARRETGREGTGGLCASDRPGGRQSEALLVLDALLNQLEHRARANEEGWERSPEAMNSRWDSTLTDHLNQIAADWPEVAPRVSDEAVRDAIVGFQAQAKASEVHEAQEERGRRQDQESIDEARALNRKVLEDTRAVRSAIDKVL